MVGLDLIGSGLASFVLFRLIQNGFISFSMTSTSLHKFEIRDIITVVAFNILVQLHHI